ncbi:MAG: biotin/lipoyl-containing protein, partial [Spirochaeta sp.]
MVKEIVVPEIADNVDSGQVTRILVSEGDSIQKDDPIIEVETE